MCLTTPLTATRVAFLVLNLEYRFGMVGVIRIEDVGKLGQQLVTILFNQIAQLDSAILIVVLGQIDLTEQRLCGSRGATADIFTRIFIR